MMAGIDWPAHLDRTPASKRIETSPYEAGLGQTTEELVTELERLGARSFRGSIANGHTKSNGFPLYNANPDDPGFALYWTTEEAQRVVAMDDYANLQDNVREVYHWIRETRKAGNRLVKTGQSQFAAAALPSADDAVEAAPAPDSTPDVDPYEVLGIDPDASQSVVKAVARQLKAEYHPDGSNPDPEQWAKVQQAEEALLNE